MRRTKDGEFAVIHDDTLDRTTDATGPVRARTMDELRRADAGSWFGKEFAGERIPTLGDVAVSLPERIELFVELKEGSSVDPGVEAALSAYLERHVLLPRVRVSSFDHRALAELRRLLPSLRTGALYVALPVDAVRLARDCGAGALHPNFHYVTAALVREAHDAGLEVHTWTVNEPEDIERTRRLGVDGLFSDHPERLAYPASS